MKVIVGTRGSKLALAQTKWVMSELEKHHPEVEFEIKVLQRLFTREIENELLSGEIDLAVHRMKDMPVALPKGLKVVGTPRREDARDTLILKEGYELLDALPKGATIATSSKRRKYQLLAYRPDLNIVPIKGDIGTVLGTREMEEQQLDGIVLAAADMHRMHLQEKVTYYLPMHIMLPAPTQGALAIEVKEENKDIQKLLKEIEDPVSTIQVTAERAFIEAINVGYHMPIGAYCEVEGTRLRMRGLLGDEEGEKLVVKELSARVGAEKELGAELAKVLRKSFESLDR